MTFEERAKHVHWLWLLLLLCSAAMLLLGLQAKSLWIDEIFTAQVAGHQSLADLLRDCIEAERRPPLHFLIEHYWLRSAGNSEFALRFPSVAFALLSLPLLGVLARKVGTGRMGLIPAGLLAFAPTFVLYARMGRAYSMATAIGLLSTILFLGALQRPSRRAWAGYIAASIVLVYTDYALLAVLAAQNLFVAYLAVTATPIPGRLAPVSSSCGDETGRRVNVRTWLAGQVIILLAFAPWLAIIVQQVQRGKLEADFARGIMGYLLKLAYPVLSLSSGETIFPWHPAALLGLLSVGALFITGVIGLIRSSAARAVFVLLFLVTPFLFTAILLSSVATDITFINMASRTLFAMPFFILVLAKGYTMLPARPWRLVVVAVLALAWGAALLNYYGGRDFHNPIYVVPMREIVSRVIADAQPGDVMVSDVDSGFGYYYAQTAATTPHFSSFSASDAAKQTITSTQSPRVWLVTLGRDRTRVDAPGELFATWLQQDYQLLDKLGYAQEDERYRLLKEKLLKRADYEYKATVRLYGRVQGR